MSDPLDLSARQLAAHIREGLITSETVTQMYLERIRQHNQPLNAVVVVDRENALNAARTADAQQAAGENMGALHGVPLTLKDTWEVAGMVTTAGASELKHHRPARDADLVSRLRKAGAIILGKTNVPWYAADVQTYNRIYGVTQNPWKHGHTCGGSSGGAAAALAAGLTPLEVGSDVGGSIRTPAHFCGVFGHKPTRDLISMRGHIPGPPGAIAQPDLAEGGPLARHADDLELLLEVLIAPRAADASCWKIDLPPPRFRTLQDVRIGYWFDDPHGPIDRTLSSRYLALAGELKLHGTQVLPARHALLKLERLLPVYYNLLGSLMSRGLNSRQRVQTHITGQVGKHIGSLIGISPWLAEYPLSMTQPHSRWLHFNELREQMREQLMALFDQHDVLLTPVTPTTAIPHDHSQPLQRRRIQVNGRTRSYMDQFHWIALATTLGLPATVAPIGHDAQGLPFGIQIIGAPGQDLGTIHMARLLEQAGLAKSNRAPD